MRIFNFEMEDMIEKTNEINQLISKERKIKFKQIFIFAEDRFMLI